MGNWQSSTREDHSSSQGGDSSAQANISIRGDGSGISGSQNKLFSDNNTINFYGSAKSSQNNAGILQCLYTSSYVSHRGRVREQTEGTCTWVIEHPKYKDWSEKKKSGLLWLSGDPGCGKSVTASFLIEHLKSRMDAIVCYFFFKDDSDEQRSPTFALCALLHQLFAQRNSLCRYAEQAFKDKGKKFTEEVDTLWDILVKAVSEGGCGDVICVVDALDECEERALAPLIRHITRLPASEAFSVPLKFIVTSRPYHRIEIELCSRETTIRLKGEDETKAVTADVNRLIDEGIKDLELVWGNRGGLEYLRMLLRSSADRTFLWVSLILELLRNSVDGSRAELIDIVSTAPASLDELYIKILSKSTDYDKALRVLNIVVAAIRPLTLIEMNIALTLRGDHKSMGDLQDDLFPSFERTVKNLCGLFVRVIDSKIYLVHQTAREFLLKGYSPSQGDRQYILYPKDSNFVMAGICLSYLSLQGFGTDYFAVDSYGRVRKQAVDDLLQKYAFLDYAARYWVDHFRDSQDQQMELFELTRPVCEAGSGRFRAWLQVYWFNTQLSYVCPTDLTHLMIASWLGQGGVVERLLAERRGIKDRSGVYGTALNIAAIRRDEDITRRLLQGSIKAYLSRREYNILKTTRSQLERLREDRLEQRLPQDSNDEREFRGLRRPREESERRRREREEWFREELELEAMKFLQKFCIPDTLHPQGTTFLPLTANLATTVSEMGSGSAHPWEEAMHQPQENQEPIGISTGELKGLHRAKRWLRKGYTESASTGRRA